jgi:hypothetical protein
MRVGASLIKAPHPHPFNVEPNGLAATILKGLETHGRGAARFVASQTGSSDSRDVLWWVNGQLPDDFSRDDETAGRFTESATSLTTHSFRARAEPEGKVVKWSCETLCANEMEQEMLVRILKEGWANERKRGLSRGAA